MIHQHLSDEEIQQYAEDRLECNEVVTAHIAVCATCRQKAAGYQQLFAAISREPASSFDFDIAALVMPQIEQSLVKKRELNLFPYLAILSVFGALGYGVYHYRKYLLNIFSGVFSYFLYLLLITAASILVFQCLDFYRSYQKKIKALGL